MRVWPKSNYRKILDKIEYLDINMSKLRKAVYQVEDIKEDQKEKTIKENKLILALEAENKLLRNELIHKNRFIESLLQQMLGGTTLKSLVQATEPKKEEKLPSSMSAAERYKAMKNGKSLPLP